MRSATDFLPRLISTLTNMATSPFEYLGSGRISRLGISLRRGMVLSIRVGTLLRLRGLRPLGAVLRAALFAILDARRVQAAPHHVVAHARKVLHAPAADEH